MELGKVSNSVQVIKLSSENHECLYYNLIYTLD